MNVIFRPGRLRLQMFFDHGDYVAWFVLPAVAVSSDDWREELCMEFFWLRWRLCVQGWITKERTYG